MIRHGLVALCAITAVGAFGLMGMQGMQATGPTMAQSGAALVAVKMPELTGDAALGAERYGTFCAACHGVSGGGIEGVGPPLIHPIYEPSHHGDASFERAALQGVQRHHWKFGDMPPVAGVTPEEVRVILAFVRSVQRANGIE